MNRASFWIVDAFTGKIGEKTLRGNPAAVVLLDEFASDGEMQEVANEFNLSETAFVVPGSRGNFDLRWMTPTVEVNLCGHATLATARALQDAGQLSQGETAQFATRSGVLTARMQGELIELDFPAQGVQERILSPSLSGALRVEADDVLFCGRGGEDWLLQVGPGVLEGLTPDFKKLAMIGERGVVVTTAGPQGSGYDFASRFFGPRVGVDEDPVTGSAHSHLATFWAERLGKSHLKAAQMSARGGWLEVELRADRVGIAGEARIRAQGQLRDSF